VAACAGALSPGEPKRAGRLSMRPGALIQVARAHTERYFTRASNLVHTPSRLQDSVSAAVMGSTVPGLLRVNF
jgi:hypothetical protein